MPPPVSLRQRPRLHSRDRSRSAIGAEPSGQPATLVFFNRPIVDAPGTRAGPGAGRARGRRTPDARRSRRGGQHRNRRIAGARRRDADSGRTPRRAGADDAGRRRALRRNRRGVAARTVARLQQALGEAAEARTPRALLRAAATAGVVILATVRCTGRPPPRSPAHRGQAHRRVRAPRQQSRNRLDRRAPRLASARLSASGRHGADHRARHRRDLRHRRRSCCGGSPIRGRGASRCAGSC